MTPSIAEEIEWLYMRRIDIFCPFFLKRMHKYFLGIVTFWVLTIFDAQAVNLFQIYQEALVHDPIYGSARAALAAGEEKVPQGRSALLPNVSISGNYLRNELNFIPTLPSNASPTHSNYPSSGYTVSLTQPLFRFTNWEQYEQSQLMAVASEAQFSQARQDLILRVAQVYFDVLAAEDALAAVQANKFSITEQLAFAKHNFEVGSSTITDTYEAQSRYDLAVSQEFATRNDLQVKRASLQMIVGRSIGDLTPLRSEVNMTLPEPAQIDQWANKAEDSNYTVIAQHANLEIAQREIKKSLGGHYPTLDFIASRVHSNQPSPSLTQSEAGVGNTNTVGIQWTIPIFSGFLVTSQTREAIALEDKARNDLENTRSLAAQAARQAFLGVSNGLEQISSLEAAQASSQASLEANKIAYQIGVRINIDVLNAQQQLYTIRQSLAKARYETIINGLRLKSSVGVLKEEDLLAVNGLLSSYEQTKSSVLMTDAGAQHSAEAAKEMPKSNVDENAVERGNALTVVEQWASAWNNQDVQRYLNFYADDFHPTNGVSHQAWEQERRSRITKKKNINVSVNAPKVLFKDGKVLVSFSQIYISDNFKQKSKKILLLSKYSGIWKIIKEESFR